MGKEFVGLLPPQEQRPLSQHSSSRAGLKAIVRDNFSLTTWLCVGATIQGLLFLLLGRIAVLPAVLVLLYRVFIAYAMTVGWMHNTKMDGVLMKKFSAQVPSEESGSYGFEPASSDIVVLLLGTRVNHPMGLFAPGAKEIGGYFTNMNKDLERHADEFGFLGHTSWLNSGLRETNSEFLDVFYFRTTEGAHAFAHSPYHREGWDWWNKTHKQYPHLSIWHEIYHAPKGHWENIYINTHTSGFASTSHKVFDQGSGVEMWASPVVDASKGLLRTSAGRMNKSQGTEHDERGISNPYA